MTIEVYSFDFDGCLFNIDYLSSNDKDIIKSNRELFKLIKSSKNKKITFVGSNRQGVVDDASNFVPGQKGSCFPAIQLVSKELGAEFDDFLMSDLYNDLVPGSAFKNALKSLGKFNEYEKSEKNKSAPNWIHDSGKLTILYAQIHKIASKNPDEPIEFNFLDDKPEILEKLHAYFLKYPELIPQNVTLRLQKYMGPYDKENVPHDPLVLEYPPIKGGIGVKPDLDYRQTVKNMAAVTIDLMNKEGHDVTSSSSATGAIKNYFHAQELNFDLSAINCINYYKPGLVADIPKDNTPVSLGSALMKKVSSFGNLFKSSKPNYSSSSSETSSSKASPNPTPLPTPSATPRPSPSPSPSPSLILRKRSSSSSESVPGSARSSSSGVVPPSLSIIPAGISSVNSSGSGVAIAPPTLTVPTDTTSEKKNFFAVVKPKADKSQKGFGLSQHRNSRVDNQDDSEDSDTAQPNPPH